MKKLYFISTLLFLSAISILGATVSGTVVDGKTGAAIAGAHIRVEGSPLGDVSNLDGHFRIEAAELPVRLLVSHISYEADTIKVERGGELKISMKQGAIVGEDVLVVGKSSASGITGDGYSLGSAEIKSRRDAGAVNLGDLILGIAGANIQVCCALDSRAELRLLGLPGAYTEINLDGIPEVGGLAANYRLYTYPAIGIERMNVSKGASSARSQAKALGGQLDILTRNPVEGPAQGSIAAYHKSVGGNQLQGELAAVAGGIGIAAAFDMAEGGAFDRDGDGWSESPSVDRSFGRLRAFFGKETAAHGTITGLYIGEERLGGMMNVARENFGREPFWVRSVNTKRYEGNAAFASPFFGGEISLSATGAKVSLDQIAGTDLTVVEEGGFIAKGAWETALAGTDFNTGIEFRRETVDDLSPDNIGRLDGSSDRISFFAEDVLFPTPTLQLKAGLRIDGDSSTRTKRAWSAFPRLSLNIDATEKLFLVLSLGSGGRFRPSVQELMEGYDHSVSVVVPADLESEKGYAASLGAEWRHIFGTNILTLAGGGSHSLIRGRIVPISAEHGGALTYINADGPTNVSSLHAQGNLDLGSRFEVQLGGELTRAIAELGSSTEKLPFTPEWRGFGKAVWKDAFGLDGLKLWLNSTAFGKQTLPENSYGISHSEPLMINDLAATFRFGPVSVSGGVWNIFDAVQSISPIQGTADPFATGVSTELVYGPLVGRTFMASVVYHFGLTKNVLIGAGYGGLVPKDDYHASLDAHEHGDDCDHSTQVVESHIHGEDCDHGLDEGIHEANVWLVAKGDEYYTCPVTGKIGLAEDAPASSIIDGEKYFHCSTSCADEGRVREALRAGFAIPGNAIAVEGESIRFLCPVMGNEGIVSEDSHFSDFEGKRYFFCCAPCKPKFDEMPEQYLQ